MVRGIREQVVIFGVLKTGPLAGLIEEDKMKFKTMIAVAMLTSVAAPAFAQSFYVVQDVKTKKCTITESKPTTSETTVVSGDTVYKTRAEAETGMKTVKVCTSN